MAHRTEFVPVDLLDIKDQLHRTKKEELSGLIESLQTTGQINPIIVRPEGKRYVVVAGRRRTSAWKAIQAMTGEKQKAMVIVTTEGKLKQELITIDENIHRKQLGEVELDEALFRRKEIYEELHPETKANVAGAHARHGKGERAKPFTADAASKLNITRKSVERAVSRAAKASPAVKKAREKGELSSSKVDALVALEPSEQDLVIDVAKRKNVVELKGLVEQVKHMGARAALRYLAEEEGETAEAPELVAIVRDSGDLAESIRDALKARVTFRAKNRFRSIRALEELAKVIEAFTDYQRVAAGEKRVIRRPGRDRGEQPRR